MTARSQVAPATDSATAALPRAGATVEALVPSGWSIEQRHEGDFNGDHRVDALLLLRQQTAGSTPRSPRNHQEGISCWQQTPGWCRPIHPAVWKIPWRTVRSSSDAAVLT
jgi:hypothetical protein